MFIYAYKMGSKSGKSLATELGIKRVRHENSKFIGRASVFVINWGSSSLPSKVNKCSVINKPECVAIAANKLKSFRAMGEAGVSIPEFTTDRGVVERDLAQNKSTWMARHELSGHSGVGIQVLRDTVGECDAPLYVKYIKKSQEYRVHVFGGSVLDIQRKARGRSVPDDQVNWMIRNHSNGFIFARNDGSEVPEMVKEQAVLAVNSMGLDFGAVDVIWNDKNSIAYVLEVNTAPGLTGTTLTNYVDRFREAYYD